jgi:hypothetical protein
MASLSELLQYAQAQQGVDPLAKGVESFFGGIESGKKERLQKEALDIDNALKMAQIQQKMQEAEQMKQNAIIAQRFAEMSGLSGEANKDKSTGSKLNDMANSFEVKWNQNTGVSVSPKKETERNYHFVSPDKKTYITDESGQLVEGVPKPNSIARNLPIDPQKREDMKDLAKYKDDAMQALVALDKIEKYAETLGDFSRGVIPQAYSKAATGVGKFAKDKKVSLYEGAVSQEFIPMARKLQEEKGPITEFDVKRVEKGFGEITTPLADKKTLINEYRLKVRKAVENKLEQAGKSVEDLKQENPSLYNMLYKKEDVGEKQEASGLPAVGGSFNGQKVLNVKRVK